ncbi:MAG: hypothetical protein PHI32_09785 [Dysgonamonadaceae bacterium]|nr:hypothetical protein [Dysgonamonadaceae bacterium]MDD4729204.1 hypothetical protein [Dysgonamonadaceae bacterium]
MKKILLTAALLTSFGISHSNAQFFKKLTERALEKTQEVVINKATDKVAEKAADKTGDAMDKLLNPDFGSLMSPSGKKVDMSKLPASYNFDYRYALKMSTQGEEIDFDYFLSKTEPYMGVKMNKGMEMSIVFDQGNKTIFTYVNGMAIATEMDLSNAVDEKDIDMYNDYTFKELPNREFLGYNCVGREMENDEYKFIVYIAPDMEAGFGNMFKSEHANIPPSMQKFSQEYENGLMMYMQMVDKKNNKKKNTTATMECIAFEPTNLVINTRQ